jgi:hypothetical protein
MENGAWIGVTNYGCEFYLGMDPEATEWLKRQWQWIKNNKS